MTDKPVMTVQELARLGGIARAAKLSAARRREIATIAGLSPKKPRAKKILEKNISPQVDDVK